MTRSCLFYFCISVLSIPCSFPVLTAFNRPCHGLLQLYPIKPCFLHVSQVSIVCQGALLHTVTQGPWLFPLCDSIIIQGLVLCMELEHGEEKIGNSHGTFLGTRPRSNVHHFQPRCIRRSSVSWASCKGRLRGGVQPPCPGGKETPLSHLEYCSVFQTKWSLNLLSLSSDCGNCPLLIKESPNYLGWHMEAFLLLPFFSRTFPYTWCSIAS